MTGTALDGWRVLVPRGGDIGGRLAGAVAAHGGTPVVAPVIDFSGPADAAAFSAACARLAAGEFDWIVVTSATTVGALLREQAAIPSTTRVAAVGEATSTALLAAGYPVDFVPRGEHSAAGLVAEWPAQVGRVLIPQSAIAEPTLADGLARRGLEVEPVTAYRTIDVPLGRSIVDAFASGGNRAILLTSGSVARAVEAQLRPLPAPTVVACIGESTAAAARAAGLVVQVTAATSSAEALVDALADYVARRQED